MSSFDKSQTRKKRKTKATAKRTMMIQRRRLLEVTQRGAVNVLARA